MTRLKPGLTVRRAPGPGPISKHDWTPLGKKHLAGKNIIFHTDSARAYKLKLRDVLHDIRVCNYHVDTHTVLWMPTY